MNSKRALRVLINASEMSPYIKTGGLADVTGSLPKALSDLGNVDVLTVIPKYKIIDDAEHDLKAAPEVARFYNLNGKFNEARLKYAEPDEGWRAYFTERRVFQQGWSVWL